MFAPYCTVSIASKILRFLCFYNVSIPFVKMAYHDSKRGSCMKGNKVSKTSGAVML
jgi:hypothetical protein